MSGGVRAGDLDQYVEIQPVTITGDTSSGEPEKTWLDEQHFYAWAEVRAIRGKEKFVAGREMASVMYEFKFQYDEQIKVSDRISWNDYLFDIQDVAPIGDRNQECLIVMAEQLEVTKV